MKTAKQMFEELGYKLACNNMYEKLNLMCYKIDLYDNDSPLIVFDLKDKTFYVHHYCDPSNTIVTQVMSQWMN